MEILVGDKTPEIEEPGVSPIHCHKRNRWSPNRAADSQAAVFRLCQANPFACRNFGADRHGCLRSATFGIPAVEAVFYEHHCIAKTCTAGYRISIRIWHFEMVGHHGHQHRQIKIAAEPPGEVEITFVRKRRACRQGNIPRGDGDQPACVENGVVGDQSPAREQRRRRLWGRSLRTCCRSKKRQKNQTEHARPPATYCDSKISLLFLPAESNVPRHTRPRSRETTGRLIKCEEVKAALLEG